MVDVEGRRVVAEHDQLDALQAHDPIGLRPAAVVADQHADDPLERAPDREAEIADLEVALLEVLERDACAVVGMARQVHLAVLADDPAVRPDQDRGVVAMRRALPRGRARRSPGRSRRRGRWRARTAARSRRSASRARTRRRSRRGRRTSSAGRRWSAPARGTPPAARPCRAPRAACAQSRRTTRRAVVRRWIGPSCAAAILSCLAIGLLPTSRAGSAPRLIARPRSWPGTAAL